MGCHVAVQINGRAYGLQTKAPEGTEPQLIQVDAANTQNFFDESTSFDNSYKQPWGEEVYREGKIMETYDWKSAMVIGVDVPFDERVVRTPEEMEKEALRWHGLEYNLVDHNCIT